MSEKLTTTKVSEKALRLLRIVAALSGEQHSAVLERLLEKEVARLQRVEQKKNDSYTYER